MPKKLTAPLFLIISLLGFLDASYLAIEHYQGKVPPCTIVIGCEIVTTSRYSVVWSIPVALLGSLYYLSIFVLTLVYFETKNNKLLKFIAQYTIIGFLASLWFMYAQFFILRALCIYCVGSAITSTLLFIIGAFYFFKGQPTDHLQL